MWQVANDYMAADFIIWLVIWGKGLAIWGKGKGKGEGWSVGRGNGGSWGKSSATVLILMWNREIGPVWAILTSLTDFTGFRVFNLI